MLEDSMLDNAAKDIAGEMVMPAARQKARYASYGAALPFRTAACRLARLTQ
jgi:hypothetical protein